jgi:hypothetical protein
MPCAIFETSTRARVCARHGVLLAIGGSGRVPTKTKPTDNPVYFIGGSLVGDRVIAFDKSRCGQHCR